jgi:capsular exopolysaccharide synthesis family protein
MMNDANINKREQQGRITQSTGGVDPLVILSLVLRKWYFFVIAVIIALLGARFYISHTMPIYRSTTLIQINETGERSMMNNDELLQGLGLPGGMRNQENQMMVLRSRALTEKTLKELSFDIEFFFRTMRNSIPIYPEIPLRVVSERDEYMPRDILFSITMVGDSNFIIASESPYIILNKQVSFDDTIKFNSGSFRIELRNGEWLKKYRDRKIYFVKYSRAGLVNYFNRRIQVELLSQGGSIISVSMDGTNKFKDVDFLNKLGDVFQSISLDKKNKEAIRRIQFIDDQLVGISDSLSTTENKLQQFRSSNRVMDLSAQGQSIIAQLTLLDNQKAELNLEANYYDYLAEYLAKDVSKEVPLVPITMGITDPALTSLVTELAGYQQQLLNRGGGEKNPLNNLLNEKVRSTKEALLETLNGLRRANSLARSDNQEQINKINQQASALPATERQLLGIERKFKLNDQLYTFLLETRANQQMQKASNVADSEVVDPADPAYSMVVAPSPIKVYFLGIFAGFGIPFLIIFLNFLFNKKLKDEDIRRMTDIPIVGNIPHHSEKVNTVVLESPSSTIAESFRLMRTRMQFFTKDAVSPVILVTSSMPGDGKTFTSINLASVYSLLGKKTILVGFDLRKPKIYEDFNLNNEKGISTWLIGQDKIDDIIQSTSFENLSLISAGPIPPNPSELISLDKTRDLFIELRERFNCIIVDSSPIGLVSDTFQLTPMADSCIIVVRSGKTFRDILGSTLREIEISETKGVTLVINDIPAESMHHGYGDKYGYTKDTEKRKWYSLKKKKRVKRN